jgi:hypothetical protein
MEGVEMSAIFPLCGISYNDVVEAAATQPNKKKAAERLGINEKYFYLTIKRLNMGHLFKASRSPKRRCISKEDIVKVAGEGYPMKDAAFLLGISYSYLRLLATEWGVKGLFMSKGRAGWVTRRGYTH